VILSAPVAPDPGVVQDALDAPPDAAGGLGLIRPDWLEDAQAAMYFLAHAAKLIVPAS